MRFFFLPKRISALAILSLLLGAFLLTGHIQQGYAQGYSSSQTEADMQRESESKLLRSLLTANLFLRESLSFLACEVRGIEPVTPGADCLTDDVATAPPGTYKPGGMLLFASNAIDTVNTPPARLTEYTHRLAGDFGIAKSAHAQVDCRLEPTHRDCAGTGYEALDQIQNIWVLMRNIVYLLLVIAFVIIGIAIMLRLKIDPRTVMTIQNQIPKIIVSIVLITFSYAIVGLLIDLMWVGTYFGINTVTSTRAACDDGSGSVIPTLGGVATRDLLNNPIAYTTDIFGDDTGCFGAFDGITGLSFSIGQTFGDIVSRALLEVMGLNGELSDCGTGQISIFGREIGSEGNLGNCVKNAIYFFFKYIIAVLAFLVVLIAILVSLFRLWFSLIKNYIMLILDIVLSPFFLFLGVLPGSSVSFSSWIRNIVAQLMVFPAAAILLVMASIIASDDAINTPGGTAFIPPLIGNPNLADNMGAIIAFGFILLTPSLLDTIREALKSPAAKQAGGVTSMIGLATGRVTGSISGAGERISGRHEAVGEFSSENETGIKYRKKGFGKIPFTNLRPGGS